MSRNFVNASDLIHQVIREAFIASKIQNYTLAIEELEKPPKWQTWGVGLSVISATCYAAPLGILLLPCLSKTLYERIMTFLIALGIGALSGSTMFIMLPQAFHLTELDDFDYHTKSTIILSALYTFFSVDRALQYILEIRRRHQARRKIHKSTIASIMHSPKRRNKTEETTVSEYDLENSPDALNNVFTESFEKREEKEKDDLKDQLEIAMMNNALARTFSTRRRVAVMSKVDEIEYRNKDDKPEAHAKDGAFLDAVNSLHKKNPLALQSLKVPVEEGKVAYLKPKEKTDDEVSVSIKIVDKRVLDKRIEVASVAYMIIFGSSANNFVDGMSMGAAFSDDVLRGLSIGVAVFSQQFPQELGTLAILVNSGLGVKRTLLFNLIPIVLSYLGFCFGVLLDNVDEGYDDYIFAISTGMYLYIFLGTLIPEIRESTNELIKENLPESILVTLLQCLGITAGLCFMYYMSTIGDDQDF